MQIGWSKTTTYTVIKKCLEKNAIERIEPNWVCHALVTKEQAQQLETKELINKMYDGAADQLTAHIRRVRKKIEPNPSNPIYIKTVWGVGYRFCES